MHLVAGDELPKVLAQLVVGVGGDVVELVHRDQPVVETPPRQTVDREAERRMGADQHLVIAFKESADGIDLAAIRRQARCRGSISARHVQSAQKPYLLKRLIVAKLAPMLFSGTTMMACFKP
jgi:hypothetical protein